MNAQFDWAGIHGIRNTYLRGCRCRECKEAHAAYARGYRRMKRAGFPSVLVDAGRAREHMRWLTSKGVGREAVRISTDLPDQTLRRIRTGVKKRIDARSEEKILKVTPEMALDHALVPAGRTWVLIGRLLDEGYTVEAINKALGYKTTKAVPLSKNKVTVRNAERVKQLYRRWTE